MAVPERTAALLERANALATASRATFEEDPLLVKHRKNERRNAGSKRSAEEAEQLQIQLAKHQQRRQLASTIEETIAKLQHERAVHEEAVEELHLRATALRDELKDYRNRVEASREDIAMCEQRIEALENEVITVESSSETHHKKVDEISDEIVGHETTLLQVEESLRMAGLSGGAFTSADPHGLRRAQSTSINAGTAANKWKHVASFVEAGGASPASGDDGGDATDATQGRSRRLLGTGRLVGSPSSVRPPRRGDTFVKIVDSAQKKHMTAKEAAQARWTAVFRAIRRGFFTDENSMMMDDDYSGGGGFDDGAVAMVQSVNFGSNPVSSGGDGTVGDAAGIARELSISSNPTGGAFGSLKKTQSVFGRSFAYSIERSPQYLKLQAQLDRLRKIIRGEDNALEAMRQRFDKQRAELLTLREVVRQYDNQTVDDLIAEIRWLNRERRELYDKLYNGKPYVMPQAQRLYGDDDGGNDAAAAASPGGASRSASPGRGGPGSPQGGGVGSRLDQMKETMMASIREQAQNPESRSYLSRVVENLRKEAKKHKALIDQMQRIIHKSRMKFEVYEGDALYARDEYLQDGGQSQREIELIRQQSAIVQEKLMSRHQEEKKLKEKELAAKDARIDRLEGELDMSLQAQKRLQEEVESLTKLRESLTEACRQRDERLLGLRAPFSPDDFSSLQATVTLVQASKPELFVADEVQQAIVKLDGALNQRIVQNFVQSGYQPIHACLQAVVVALREMFRDDVRKTTCSIECLATCAERIKECLLATKKMCRKATLTVMEVASGYINVSQRGGRRSSDDFYSVATQTAGGFGGGGGFAVAGGQSREVQVGKPGVVITLNAAVDCHIPGMDKYVDATDLDASSASQNLIRQNIQVKQAQQRIEKLAKSISETRRKGDTDENDRRIAELLYDVREEFYRLEIAKSGIENQRMTLEDHQSQVAAKVEEGLERARLVTAALAKQILSTPSASSDNGAAAMSASVPPNIEALLAQLTGRSMRTSSTQTTAVIPSEATLQRTVTMRRTPSVMVPRDMMASSDDDDEDEYNDEDDSRGGGGDEGGQPTGGKGGRKGSTASPRGQRNGRKKKSLSLSGPRQKSDVQTQTAPAPKHVHVSVQTTIAESDPSAAAAGRRPMRGQPPAPLSDSLSRSQNSAAGASSPQVLRSTTKSEVTTPAMRNSSGKVTVTGTGGDSSSNALTKSGTNAASFRMSRSGVAAAAPSPLSPDRSSTTRQSKHSSKAGLSAAVDDSSKSSRHNRSTANKQPKGETEEEGGTTADTDSGDDQASSSSSASDVIDPSNVMSSNDTMLIDIGGGGTESIVPPPAATATPTLPQDAQQQQQQPAATASWDKVEKDPSAPSSNAASGDVKAAVDPELQERAERLQNTVEELRAQLAQALNQIDTAVHIAAAGGSNAAGAIVSEQQVARMEFEIDRLRGDRDKWRHLHDVLENRVATLELERAALLAPTAAAGAMSSTRATLGGSDSRPTSPGYASGNGGRLPPLYAPLSDRPPGSTPLFASAAENEKTVTDLMSSADVIVSPKQRDLNAPPSAADTTTPRAGSSTNNITGASALPPRSTSPSKHHSAPYTIAEVMTRIKDTSLENDSLKIALDSEQQSHRLLKAKVEELEGHQRAMQDQYNRSQAAQRQAELRMMAEIDALKGLLKEARVESQQATEKLAEAKRQGALDRGAFDRKIASMQLILLTAEQEKTKLRADMESLRARVVGTSTASTAELERMKAAHREEALKLRTELGDERAKVDSLQRRLNEAIRKQGKGKRGPAGGDGGVGDLDDEGGIAALSAALTKEKNRHRNAQHREAQSALRALQLHSALVDISHAIKAALFVPAAIDDPVAQSVAAKGMYQALASACTTTAPPPPPSVGEGAAVDSGGGVAAADDPTTASAPPAAPTVAPPSVSDIVGAFDDVMAITTKTLHAAVRLADLLRRCGSKSVGAISRLRRILSEQDNDPASAGDDFSKLGPRGNSPPGRGGSPVRQRPFSVDLPPLHGGGQRPQSQGGDLFTAGDSRRRPSPPRGGGGSSGVDPWKVMDSYSAAADGDVGFVLGSAPAGVGPTGGAAAHPDSTDRHRQLLAALVDELRGNSPTRNRFSASSLEPPLEVQGSGGGRSLNPTASTVPAVGAGTLPLAGAAPISAAAAGTTRLDDMTAPSQRLLVDASAADGKPLIVDATMANRVGAPQATAPVVASSNLPPPAQPQRAKTVDGVGSAAAAAAAAVGQRLPRTLTPFAAVVEGQRRAAAGSGAVGGASNSRDDAGAHAGGDANGWNSSTVRTTHTLEIAALLSEVPPRPATTMPSSVRQRPVEILAAPMSSTVAPHAVTEGFPRRVGTPAAVQAARSRQLLAQLVRGGSSSGSGSGN